MRMEANSLGDEQKNPRYKNVEIIEAHTMLDHIHILLKILHKNRTFYVRIVIYNRLFFRTAFFQRILFICITNTL